MMSLTILIVDDEPLMRLSIVDALEAVGHDVCAAATGTEGIEEARRRDYDLVITDLRLPGADGLAVLKAAKEVRAQTEVVVITAHGSVETAVGAMKLGAFDYITKPFKMDELLLIVERAGTVIALRKENQDLKEILEDKFSFGGILGSNTKMRAVLDKIKPVLNQAKPARTVALSKEEQAVLKPMFLLTTKPAMYVANVSEQGFQNNPLLDRVMAFAKSENAPVVAISAAIEAQIADLDEEDLALLEARDLLFARLLQYRAYKEVSALFAQRMAVAGRALMVQRLVGSAEVFRRHGWVFRPQGRQIDIDGVADKVAGHELAPIVK